MDKTFQNFGRCLGSCTSAANTCSPLPYCLGAKGFTSCNLFGVYQNLFRMLEFEFCSICGTVGID